ncbi:MAG: Ig-like domain-containing protein, partial [Ilumatobacteraceae bacterium]
TLTYQGTLNFNGADTLTVLSTDSAGVPLSDSDTVAITVNPVNDAPAGTDTTVTTNEDVAHVFTVASFGFTDVDAGDTMSAVRIAALPAAGTLTLNGAAVAANDVILVADINAGLLQFTPAANQNGAPYTTFTFSVRDQANAFDAAPNTMRVDVTAVDDLPAANNDVYATIEDTPLVVAAATGILTNDSGFGDGGIAVSVLGVPVGGTVVVNNDGSFTFTPTTNFNGPATFTYQVTDADGDIATAMVSIAVAAVNDDPALGSNSFAVTDGGTLTIGGANLSASDIDDAAASLVFTVGGVSHGYFVLTSNPGVPVTSFTQADVAAGLVQLVHDGSGVAPTFNIYVADGSGGGTGPVAANIVFTGGGAVSPPPFAGGGGGGSTPTVTPPPVLPSTTVAVAPGVAGLTTFFRGPTEAPGDGSEDAAAEEIKTVAVTAPSVEKRIGVDMQLPPVRVEPDVIETQPLRTDVEVAPIHAEMQAIPTRHNLELDDEERARIEVVLNSVRITGLAFSVGAVWWAARAAGLVARQLASSPAGRHLDPLPVLGRDDEEESEWDGDSEEEKDQKDDEHRAAWVLEERQAS